MFKKVQKGSKYIIKTRRRSRAAASVATQGRYELLTPKEPKHRSATCVVHFALDHGEEPPVERVLKFMRNREQWDREVAVRGGVADGGQPSAAAGSGAEASAPADSSAAAAAEPAALAANEAAAAAAAGAAAASSVVGEAAAAAVAAAPAALAAAMAAATAAAATGAAEEGPVSKRRLYEEYVLPVLRQHELPAEETTEKRVFAGAEVYPYVLVMERGDEDLSGARLTLSSPLCLTIALLHRLLICSPMPAKRLASCTARAPRMHVQAWFCFVSLDCWSTQSSRQLTSSRFGFSAWVKVLSLHNNCPSI